MKTISALFLDLDDTIFPSNIPASAFERLFSVVDEHMHGIWDAEKIGKVKEDLWKYTFREAAEIHDFDRILRNAYRDRLRKVEFNFDIKPYDDYGILHQLPQDRYLVTSGSRPVQEAKVRALGIAQDFIRICYDDPLEETNGKKDLFLQLIQEEGLHIDEILVIGDNYASEIRAARELGIDYRVVDRAGRYRNREKTITSFHILKELLDS